MLACIAARASSSATAACTSWRLRWAALTNGRRCLSAAAAPAPPPVTVGRASSRGGAGGGGSGGGGAAGDRVPRVAALLGAGGLLPFVWYAAQVDPIDTRPGRTGPGVPRGDRVIAAAAAAVGVPADAVAWMQAGDQTTVRRRLIAYGSSILSFMGAVHWGIAMMAPAAAVPSPSRLYAVSVVPALIGWGAACAPITSPWPLVALSGGFAGVWLWDEAQTASRGVPAWYTFLRTPLTLVVLVSLVGSAYVSRKQEGV